MVCVMSNSPLFETVVLDSNRNKHVPPKSFKKIIPLRESSWKKNSEQRPLLSTTSDSNSDEEVTLHDVRHLKSKNGTIYENEVFSNLRKVPHRGGVSNVSNGNITKSEKTKIDHFSNYDFKHLKIEDGETLQSISIKYHCPIADLKRANNLITDQEFYGLKFLKVPVKKHGILSESFPTVHTIRINSSTSSQENDCDVKTINIGLGSVACDGSPRDTVAFFKRMDEDLIKIMLSTNSQKDSLEAAAAALTTPQIQSLLNDPYNDTPQVQPLLKDPYNGIDCGIQWNYLIIFVIILAFIIPIGIAVYMYIKTLHESHVHVVDKDAKSFNIL